MRPNDRKYAIVSLKWPTYLRSCGYFKVFEGETVGMGDPFKVRVVRALVGKKWVDVAGEVLSVTENSVVSRQYVEPNEQGRLPFAKT